MEFVNHSSLVTRHSSLFVAAVLAATAASSAETKKFIYASWEIGDVTPEEILAHADQFDKTACDGLSLGLRAILPGAAFNNSRHVMEEPRWLDSEIDALLPVYQELTKHPSMKHCFASVNTAPRKERLAWTNDAAWALYADNMRANARFAKLAGFEGVLTDFEDYWHKKQFRWMEGDPDWEETKKIARRRGAEVFGAVFGAYPDAAILTFQLLTTDTEYPRQRNPRLHMEEKRDLWPAFVNGILDVLPPGAKLIDGNESFGYTARASRNDFYKSVRDQISGVLPLVEPENRAKYRTQLSISFGLYVDAYACPTNSPWYLEPVRGKRIYHFEDNLRQACEAADEYIWFWGEKGFWIDWPADLKDGKDWKGFKDMTWRGKYFEGGWGRIKPWNETLDGNFDLMTRGVKEPYRCVQEEYARQKADGSFKDLAADKPLNVATNGGASTFIRSRFETDGWYGVKVKGRGEIVRGNIYFQSHGSWRWKLGSFRIDFAPPDAEGWRDGAALVRIPGDATDLYILLDAGKEEKVRKVEFKDLEVFRIQ